MLLIIFYKRYTFQRGNLFTLGPTADQYMNSSRKKKSWKQQIISRRAKANSQQYYLLEFCRFKLRRKKERCFNRNVTSQEMWQLLFLQALLPSGNSAEYWKTAVEILDCSGGAWWKLMKTADSVESNAHTIITAIHIASLRSWSKPISVVAMCFIWEFG